MASIMANSKKTERLCHSVMICQTACFAAGRLINPFSFFFTVGAYAVYFQTVSGRFKALPAAQGTGLLVDGAAINRYHAVAAYTNQEMPVFHSVVLITGSAVIHQCSLIHKFLFYKRVHRPVNR